VACIGAGREGHEFCRRRLFHIKIQLSSHLFCRTSNVCGVPFAYGEINVGRRALPAHKQQGAAAEKVDLSGLRAYLTEPDQKSPQLIGARKLGGHSA
jgi:hypothetical protein